MYLTCNLFFICVGLFSIKFLFRVIIPSLTTSWKVWIFSCVPKLPIIKIDNSVKCTKNIMEIFKISRLKWRYVMLFRIFNCIVFSDNVNLYISMIPYFKLLLLKLWKLCDIWHNFPVKMVATLHALWHIDKTQIRLFIFSRNLVISI